MEKNSESNLKSLHDMLNGMFESLQRSMLENNQNMEKNLSEMKADNLKNLSEMKAVNQSVPINLKSLQKTMSEMKVDNEQLQINLEKKLSDVQVNLERKISENSKELKDDVREIREENKNEDEKVQLEFNNKIKDSSKDINEKDDKVNSVIQIVQAEDEKCTEEILKRQGEKAAQLYANSNDTPSELSEEIDWSPIIENTWVPDICISTTQANYGVTSESTIEKTHDYKSICMFTKYAYTFKTVRIYATLHEKDKVISYNKVTKYKKYRTMEWCINVKREKVYVQIVKKMM
jgi:hypothetical protein